MQHIDRLLVFVDLPDQGCSRERPIDVDRPADDDGMHVPKVQGRNIRGRRAHASRLGKAFLSGSDYPTAKGLG
jgi:hypothetical protein